MELGIVERTFMVGGASPALGRDSYPYVPTVVDIDVSWGAERVMTAPDAARATVRLWLPDSSLSAHLPSIGLACRIELTDGTETARLLDGVVDEVTRERRHSTTPGAAAEPLPELPDPELVQWSQHGAPLWTTELQRRPRPGVVRFYAPPLGWPVVETRVTGVLDLSTVASPNTWLWAGPVDERVAYPPEKLGDTTPEPTPGGAPPAPFYWRADGVYTPVTDGPLVIGSTVPADLALVAWIDAGAAASLSWPVARPLTAPVGRHPAGEWVEVVCSDLLAPAGRHRIGDTPWPNETVSARLARLRDLDDGERFPVQISANWPNVTSAAASSVVRVAARDVDSQPILGIYADTLAAVGCVPVVAGDNRTLMPGQPSTMPRALDVDGTVTDHPDLVRLAASTVPAVPISASLDELTNHIRVSYLDATDVGEDPTERYVELVNAGSIARWGESTATYSTPAVMLPGDSGPEDGSVLGAVLGRLRSALSGLAWPEYRFAAPLVFTPTLLAHLPAAPATGRPLVWLTDTARRHGAVLRIEHSVPELPEDYAVRGGSVVFDRGAVVLTLDVEAASHAGVTPITYAALELSPAGDLRYFQIDPDITYSDVRTISALPST